MNTERWPVIGHEWAVEMLAGALARGQLSHAYLFTGPEGIGKTTLALAFAQALICQAEDAPCGECDACRRVQGGIHPDVWLVEPQEGLLRVEQVREVTREASRRPLEAPYRIFILTHMEQAHPAAANALLKTLEEPPAHVVLILTAPAEDAILPTLVSRCQVLPLRPVPEETLVRALVAQHGVAEERALLLARISGGRPGGALRAHTDEAFWHQRDQAFALVATFAENEGRWVRLQVAEEQSRWDVDRLLAVLRLLQTIYRDVLLLQEGLSEALHNPDRAEELQTWAQALHPAAVREFLRRLIETQQHVQGNVNTRLALDVLYLHAPTAGAAIRERGAA